MQINPDYTNRFFDIETAQTIVNPEGETRLTISLTNGQRVITGIQKLVQQYMIIFLTMVGDVKFNPEFGTLLLTSIIGGGVNTYGNLFSVFAVANLDTIKQILDGAAGMPDDEVIASAELLDLEIDTLGRKILFRIKITSVAGDSTEFIMPTSIVRS